MKYAQTIATGKMANFIGLGNETTFGFSQFQTSIVGCEPMSTYNLTKEEQDEEEALTKMEKE